MGTIGVSTIGESLSSHTDDQKADGDRGRRRVVLSPSQDGGAVSDLLRHRRSTKSYLPDPVGLDTLSSILRTTVGSTPATRRPYGSAHARYDIVVTVVAAAVEGLAPAAYRYLPAEHTLVLLDEGDHRARLASGTLDAAWAVECPVVLLLSADLAAANDAFEVQEKGRGERFCWFEAGLITQNIHLWAAENSLGTVFLGGLDSTETHAATRRFLPSTHTVLGMVPLGRPADAVPSAR